MSAQAKLPFFCSHEHWGSFSAIGHKPEGFIADLTWGARPMRDAGLMDLLIDPYLGGSLAAAGFDHQTLARRAGHEDIFAWGKQSPAQAREAAAEAFAQQRMTGMYQALRRGIRALYEVDIDDCDDGAWAYLDARVGENYRRIFGWYREAMARAGLAELTRLVWPEMYVQEQESASAAEERSFTHTLMRVDSLMDMWKTENPRRDAYARMTGIDPHDPPSWRAFIESLFSIAARSGCLGTKQAQAYKRSLDYRPVDDHAVVWRGDLNAEQVRLFQDWVMHECFRQTHLRAWPHHCHVGTHNLPESDPLPLAAIARQYPDMKIVMLHCWPYLDEAGLLAKHHPNVYIDMCWQVILNPEFLRRALESWLGYLPLHKLTIGQDATSIEMAAGAAELAGEIIEDVLDSRRNLLGLSKLQARHVAKSITHNNAVRLYHQGQEL